MKAVNSWTRDQLLIAFKLYCQLPFGKLHHSNPIIIEHASLIERTPSALAMKLTNIASLDPAITSTGRKGLSGASATDKAMWNEMTSNWNSFASEIARAEAKLIPMNFLEGTSEEIAPENEESEIAPNYQGKTKIVTTRIRVGQDFFRHAVLSAYNFKCCISGLSIPQLLIASHIIPWKTDENNRLNPKNGLCLSSLHDKAFDKGIITLSESLTVEVASNSVTASDSFFRESIMSFEGKQITLPDKFRPAPEFLQFHRTHIYRGRARS